jgi:hypothetical protein
MQIQKQKLTFEQELLAAFVIFCLPLGIFALFYIYWDTIKDYSKVTFAKLRHSSLL